MADKKRIAVFPGTFDPLTNGHLDIIRRGAEIFDKVIVGVGQNPSKTSMLDQQARSDIARQAVASMPNVRVDSYEGLTTDFVRKAGGSVILRGIRDSGDLHHEFQIALTNRQVADIETVFIMTAPKHSFISSSLIRQIAAMGGDISSMVPPEVLEHLSDKAQ